MEALRKSVPEKGNDKAGGGPKGRPKGGKGGKS
jgi:hypothetical protein